MELDKETNDRLKSKYCPEGSDLRTAQYQMLDILKFVDKVCKDNHLTYWLEDGTLLGAARHGGFIPWDDDVDITMPRRDLLKLRHVMKKYCGDDYILHNHSTDKNYFCSWDVMRDLKHEYIQNSKIHNIRKYKGLQVDIFPVEECINKKLWGWSNMIQIRYIDIILEKGGSISFVRLNHFLFNHLLKPMCRLLSKLSFKKGVYSMDFGCYFDENHKISNIYPLKKIEFEGYYFNAPNDINAYLTDIYGDWRKIPDIIHTHNFVFK